MGNNDLIKISAQNNDVTLQELSQKLGKNPNYASNIMHRQVISGEEYADWLEAILSIVTDRKDQMKKKKQYAADLETVSKPLDPATMSNEGAMRMMERILAIELNYVRWILREYGRYAAIRELESNWAFAYTGADAEDLVSALEARKEILKDNHKKGRKKL